MTHHPRRRRPDHRPDEILDAALSLFSEAGFAQARVDDIARRAGVSKGTIYLYFDSKEAMIAALVEQSSARIVDAASAFINHAADRDPAAGLRSVFKMLFKTIIDPDISAASRLIMAEGARFPSLARHYRRRVIDTGHAAIERVMQAGIDQGVFRPTDLDAANRVVIGPAVTQLLMSSVFREPDDPEPDADAFADAIADLIMHGLLTDPAST